MKYETSEWSLNTKLVLQTGTNSDKEHKHEPFLMVLKKTNLPKVLIALSEYLHCWKLVKAR
jgi:hypothetical protein